MHRVLISKLLWDIDNFTSEDLLALFDNQLFLEDLASKNESFRKKFQVSLEDISNYLKAVKFKKIEDLPRIAEKFKRFIKIKLNDFIYPQRNYPEQLRRYKQYVEFRWTEPEGTLVSQLPPVKYIGKGYTDKGNAKKPHLDGSPSWQNVASRRKYDPQDINWTTKRDVRQTSFRRSEWTPNSCENRCRRTVTIWNPRETEEAPALHLEETVVKGQDKSYWRLEYRSASQFIYC